jgi:hypothetical protein
MRCCLAAQQVTFVHKSRIPQTDFELEMPEVLRGEHSMVPSHSTDEEATPYHEAGHAVIRTEQEN